MSTANTGQTPARGPLPGPLRSGSDPHKHGHLVSTGFYERDGVHRMFIHLSSPSIGQHECLVYSCDYSQVTGGFQVTGGDQPSPSADRTVQEHGWFRDTNLFRQICNNQPAPTGQNSRAAFENWRDNLLAFLDATHRGGMWTRTN
jgi:hypothetical protein